MPAGLIDLLEDRESGITMPLTTSLYYSSLLEEIAMVYFTEDGSRKALIINPHISAVALLDAFDGESARVLFAVWAAYDIFYGDDTVTADNRRAEVLLLEAANRFGFANIAMRVANTVASRLAKQQSSISSEKPFLAMARKVLSLRVTVSGYNI